MYQQLPARSPLSLAALLSGASHLLGVRRDPRPPLERALRERFAADGVILCGSGTHALQLALGAVRALRGDEAVVLLPAYTCFEVATAAVGAGARVALYDVDPDSLQPDWPSVREAASGRVVGALVVAPLYGTPIDWSTARACARELGALLIEDAAQGQGSTDGSAATVGSFGDLSILSFGRGKGWTGLGGGALMWREAGGAAGAGAGRRPLRRTGPSGQVGALVKGGAQWLLGRPAIYAAPASIPWLRLGETVYHDPDAPRRMSPLSAAIALATRDASEAEVRLRRRAAREYDERLEGDWMADASEERGPGMLRYPILVEGGWTALRADGGAALGAGPPYPSVLADLPALRPLLVNPDARHPGAGRLVAQLVTLPTHGLTTVEERSRLADRVAARVVRPAHS